jgi:hypothetical protein
LVELPEAITQSESCWAHKIDTSAECSKELSFTTLQNTARFNDGEYPGGFYAIMHLFVSNDLQRSVWVMRSVNTLLAATVLVALFWLLPAASRRLLVYTAAATFVPLVFYFLTSINPTGWGILGVMTAWFGLYGAYAGETRGRQIGLAGIGVVGALLAALARSDSAIMCVIAAAAVVVLNWNSIGRVSLWRKRWVQLVACATVAIVGVIGFLAGNQRRALEGMSNTVADRNPLSVIIFNITNLPGLLSQVWDASLGWLDTPLAPLTTVSAMVVAFGLFFWGIRHGGLRKNLALAGVTFVLIALPLVVLQQSLNTVGEAVQPRYLAPLVVVLIGAALTNPDGRGSDRLSATQTTICYGLLAVAHSLALHSLMRRVITGDDVDRFNLNIGIEWWPVSFLSPMAVWAVGSLGFAATLLVLFTVRRRDDGMPANDQADMVQLAAGEGSAAIVSASSVSQTAALPVGEVLAVSALAHSGPDPAAAGDPLAPAPRATGASK